MKYTVKLLEADVINKNNRCYSKEVVEKINEQLNSNTINIYNHNIYEAENEADYIIGQTIKCSSRIEKDTLIVNVNLKKPMSAKFINICCAGHTELSNNPRMSYNGNITVGLNGLFHDKIEEPEVLYLFNDNTNSYYDDSNIVSQNNKLEIE